MSLNLYGIEANNVSGLFSSVYLPLPRSLIRSYVLVMCLISFSLVFIMSLGLLSSGVLKQSAVDRAAYKQQTFIPPSSGGWKSEIRVPAPSSSGVADELTSCWVLPQRAERE